MDAGLIPRHALWSATAGPAQFAKLDGTMGSIAIGQIADLVVLNANPLADIRNTRRIDSVVQAGRLFRRPELDAILAGVRAANAAK